jgi:hypothetical protein
MRIRLTHMILFLGAIAALMLGGVIEVNFHPDKIADVPGAVMGAARDGSLYEKARVQAVNIKRLAEGWLIKDDQQRLAVALSNVERDSERLKSLNERGAKEEALTAQSNLLKKSLDRLSQVSQEVSLDDLVSLKDKVATAVNNAQTTLNAISEWQNRFAKLAETFENAKQALERQVGKFGNGGVAGAQRVEQPSDIPLKF